MTINAITLEVFLDELVNRARAKSYTPSTFIKMRHRHGSVDAIRRLVETSEPQSGFRKLQALGLEDWSVEAAVVRFPKLFSAKTFVYAKARLEGTLDG